MGPVGIRARESGGPAGWRGRSARWRVADRGRPKGKPARPRIASPYAVVSVMLTSSYTSIKHKGRVSDVCRPQEGRLQTRARAGQLGNSRRGRRPVQRMSGLRPPTYGRCPDRRNFRRPRGEFPTRAVRQKANPPPASSAAGANFANFRDFRNSPRFSGPPCEFPETRRCVTMRHFRAMCALRPTPCAALPFRPRLPSTPRFARFK